MTDRSPNDNIAPKEWIDRLMEEVDLDSAYDSIENLDRFWAESLKGLVRRLQLRTREAWKHLETAEDLYDRMRPEQRSESQYRMLKVRKLENAILEEAMGVGAPRRTDRLVLSLLEENAPSDPVLVELMTLNGAYYKLARGEFASALEILECLLETKNTAFEDQEIAFHCGIAAAAQELGWQKKADDHFQSALLGTSMVTMPFKICLYGARLHGLLRIWNRHDEAAEWLARVEAVNCPNESKRCFIERAKILANASIRSHSLYLA